MKGRPRLPTAVKKLKGTDRADRANPAEPVYAPGPPAAPLPVLRGVIERRLWKETVALLASAGVLTTADRQVVARFCILTARLIRNRREQQAGRWAQTIIERDAQGNKRVRKHPLIAIENDTVRELRAIETELGLTPASRSKVRSVTADAPSETPLAQLQRQAAGLRRVK